jgi:histidyl-tRNA synthetase
MPLQKFLDQPPVIAIAPMGYKALMGANTIAHELRSESPESWDPRKRYRILVLSSERNLKSQIRQAAAAGAKYLVILGEREQSQGVVQLRELNATQSFSSPDQESVPIAKLVAVIKDRLFGLHLPQ